MIRNRGQRVSFFPRLFPPRSSPKPRASRLIFIFPFFHFLRHRFNLFSYWSDLQIVLVPPLPLHEVLPTSLRDHGASLPAIKRGKDVKKTHNTVETATITFYVSKATLRMPPRRKECAPLSLEN